MLRIIQQRNAGAAKSYYARSDYYLEGQELPGRWGGKGAERLGLEGMVDQKSFERLCDNLHPATGEKLSVRTRGDRTVLYDWNFHVPKGVSLLYETTRDERILERFREAMRSTMEDAEAEAKTRIRSRGRNEERTTGNLVYGEFVHFTTRPAKEDGIPDPHLHGHICVFNLTHDNEERRWKAAQFRDLKRDAPYWEAAFHSRLARSLKELGYDIERRGRDWDVGGVAAATKLRFSRRTAEIERMAEELGIDNPAAKDKLGAATRQRKRKELGRGELRDIWLARLSEAEQATLAAVAEQAKAREGGEAAERSEESFRYACDHSFARDSVVAERQLFTEALRFGLGSVTPESVRQEAVKQGLLAGELDGKRMATTHEVLAEERAMIAFAREGRGTCRPMVEAPGPSDWAGLNADQAAAVSHVLGSTDRVTMVVGKAGVGKTTLLLKVVGAVEARGGKVFAFAPSADASRGVLRSEGFADADTVARLLVDPRMQEQVAGQVILVDEAGQVGTQSMNSLFNVAERQNARVILTGDPTQHAPVERGTPLVTLQKEAGIVPATVSDIQRQKGAYKEAVARLAGGDVLGGFDRLAQLGWVQELSGEERDKAIARDYVAALHAGDTALIVSPTHDEGDRITQAVRGALREAGRLGAHDTAVGRLIPTQWTVAERGDALRYEPGQVIQFMQNAPGFKRGERVQVISASESGVTVQAGGGAARGLPLAKAKSFQVFRTSALAVVPGDVLRITANGSTKDGAHRLNNGSTYTLKSVTAQGDLTLTNGWLLAKDYGHLSHGYVATSHASQGKTVDRVLIGQASASYGASSREQFYVSASRGRKSVAVYTDDRDSLRHAIQRTDARYAASDLVRPLAARPRPAHAVERIQRWKQWWRMARAWAERVAARERTVHQRREIAYER